MIKKIFIVLTIISSIATPFTAFAVSCFVGDVGFFGTAGMSYLWIAFCFLPITVGCIIFGLLVVRKERAGLANIVVGIITSLITIAMGACSSISEVDKSGLFLKEAGEITNIAMPTDVQAMSIYEYGGRIGNARILNKAQEENFASEIKEDKWVTSLSAACRGCLPLSVYNTYFDYFCFYLIEENVFNPIAIENGQHKIVFIAYQSSGHHIMVFDSYTFVQ